MLRVLDLCSSSSLVFHDQHSHEILQPTQFNASLEDNDFSPAPSDPDDSDAEDDEVEDADED